MTLRRYHIVALIFFSFSINAYADLVASNDTDVDGTAKAFYYIQNKPYEKCSSAAGEIGIIKNHDKMVILQKYIDMYCTKKACDAQVYMTRDCSGPPVATLSIDAKKNEIEVRDNHVGKYRVKKTGNMAVLIHSKQDNNITGFIKKLFG